MNAEKKDIYQLTKAFAIKITKLYQQLTTVQKEYIMSKQVFRSGTSIGANVFEGKEAQSRADFSSKMSIALKEASETGYWLDLLYSTGYIDTHVFHTLNDDCEHLKAILINIVRATKQ